MINRIITVVLRTIITSSLLVFIAIPFVFTGLTIVILFDDYVSYLPETYALGTFFVVEMTWVIMKILSIFFIVGSIIWQCRPQMAKTSLTAIKYEVNS